MTSWSPAYDPIHARPASLALGLPEPPARLLVALLLATGLAAALLWGLSLAAPPVPGGFTPVDPDVLLAHGLTPRLSLRLRVPPPIRSGASGGRPPRSGFDRQLGEAAALLAPAFSERGLARAIARLEAAASLRPGDAAVASDLAALHFEQARLRRRPTGALRALAQADRAVRLDPGSADAWFNRAFLLTHLGLWPEARASWREALRLGVDPASTAAVERLFDTLDRAERRRFRRVLPAIREAARAGDGEAVREGISDVRSQARQHLEERLLPAWAKAQLAGDLQGAAESLDLAGMLAGTLDDLSGEALYAESVAAIRDAAGDPERLAAIALGFRDLGRGVPQLQADAAAALQTFERARRAFARAYHPFAVRAALKSATAKIYLQRLDEARKDLGRLARVAAARGYHNDAFEIAWLIGLSYNSQANLQASLVQYERALALALETGDVDRLSGIQNLLAERSAMLGELDGAWEHLQAALSRTLAIESPMRLYQIYMNAALASLRLDQPEAGLLFLDESLRHARALGNPLALVEGYRWRASLNHGAGRREQAGRDLATAERYLADVEPEQRGYAEMVVLLVKGELAIEDDPAAAAELLGRSAGLLEASEYRATRAVVHAALGRAHAAEGDLGRAAAGLRRSAVELAALQGSLSAATERIHAAREAARAFDALAAVELRRGRGEAAFLALERKQGWAVLDRLAGPRAPLYGAGELRAALPADRALVGYAAVDGRMRAWVLHRGLFRWLDLGLEEDELRLRADRFVKALQGDAPLADLRAGGGELYDELIAALAEHLPPGVALVIVAGEPLAAFPFAALVDPRTGRCLIEDRALAFAPSANVYVRMLRRDRALPAAKERRALVFGNPRLGPEDRHLEALPRAEEEARQVAALYPGTHPLLGPAAIREVFLDRAGACEIVHFAGHAVADLDSPASSKLLFSPANRRQGSGALMAREVGEMSFAFTRLLVLGACSTAGGSATGEGIDGLAHPFLAAGVPGVVASLWRVEDAPAAELLVAFHRELAAGRDAMRALQAAQVALRRSPRRSLNLPSGWAAFRLIGEASPPDLHRNVNQG